MAVGSLGLLIGLLVGLSTSPVVGTFVGTIAALAVTLLSAGLGTKSKDKDPISKKANEAQPVKFNYAAIVGFSLFCILGIISGIWLRTHDILSPSLERRLDC